MDNFDFRTQSAQAALIPILEAWQVNDPDLLDKRTDIELVCRTLRTLAEQYIVQPVTTPNRKRKAKR